MTRARVGGVLWLQIRHIVDTGWCPCSHVNDAGFWLFKEYFNLDLQDTFRSWTAMESLAGGVGLLCVPGLNLVLPLYARP